MLQPGTLTSTSLGRVRVSSAVCAITSPPGSPPGRHYTQVSPLLPPEHARPRPNQPQGNPPRTFLSPQPCPCWRPGPPHLPLSSQHLYTEGPITPGTHVPRRPSPPCPRVWLLSWHAGPAPRPAQGTPAPAHRLPPRRGQRSSWRPRAFPQSPPREGTPPKRPPRAAPRNRGPPRTATRALRFPFRAGRRARARLRPSLVGNPLRRPWARG